MLVLIDNGKMCSDHTLYFIDVKSDEERKRIDAIVAYANTESRWGYKPCEGMAVVAEIAKMRWFRDGPMTLEAFIDLNDWWLCDDQPDGSYGLMV